MSKQPLALAGAAISAVLVGVSFVCLLLGSHGDATWGLSKNWLMLSGAVGVAGLLVSWAILFPEETAAQWSGRNRSRRGRTSAAGYDGVSGGDSHDGGGDCGGDGGSD